MYISVPMNVSASSTQSSMLYTVRQFIYLKQACIVALLCVDKPRLRKKISKLAKRKYKFLKLLGYGEIRKDFCRELNICGSLLGICACT